MKQLLFGSAAFIALGSLGLAQDVTEIDKAASELNEILAESVEIPAGEQEARIVIAKFDPMTAGSWHVHPTPVYLYVTEGELTLEVEGKEARTLKAGDATAEPLDARMRAVNKTDQPVEVVVFQISVPEKAFLEEEKTD